MKQTDIVSTLTHPEGTVAALAVIWRLVSAVQFYFLLFFVVQCFAFCSCGSSAQANTETKSCDQLLISNQSKKLEDS